MTTYNFKKETKLYVVRDGVCHPIEIYPDLSFSQTFDETTLKVKTLHSLYDLIDDAIITKANPANFSFTIPLLQEAELDVLLDMLISFEPYSDGPALKTADLFVESNSEIYKLEKAVIERGTFNIQQDSFLSLSISGSARRLSTVNSLEGIPVARAANEKYTSVTALNVVIGKQVQPHITSVSLEVANDVSWLRHETIHNSIGISVASETQFPEDFVVSGRTVSGTIQQYITDETNKNVNSWKTNEPMLVQIGKSGDRWALEFRMPSVVYTNRSEVQDIFIQSYDFRLTGNSVPLDQIIKKRSPYGTKYQ